MTTSLPKIKTVVENSESGSQKQLKFKKLKLNTDSSAADIRQRFKSVRTERLTSLERYSTVEGQREYKKEKIHLNLLERKLLSGTYDEAKETGNDLNSLKQKTDYYKTQAAQKQIQTDKIKALTQELKLEIQNLQAIRRKNQEAVQKVNRRFEQQKSKTDTLIYDRNSLQHMIIERKRINHHLEAQINEDKAYVAKLKSVVKQVYNEARESKESAKNLISRVERINEDALRQQRSREEIMYEKQAIINKRKDDEKLREDKSKQFRKSLDVAEEESEKKEFMDLYRAILAQLFIQRYSQVTMESLQEKYQTVENMFKQVGSYQKFDLAQPNGMAARFNELKPETASYQQKIKKLEAKLLELEEKNRNIEKWARESKMIVKPASENTNGNQLKAKTVKYDDQNQADKEREKKIEAAREEIKETEQAIFKIDKWQQRFGLQFEIKTKRGGTLEDIGKNIVNVLKVVVKQKQVLQSKDEKSRNANKELN